jgi:hypothetical protein
VLAHEYLADESYGTSQSFFSSKVRHEKCYAQKILLPTITARDIDIESTSMASLEGMLISQNDIRIVSGGDASMASRLFYQTLDYSETAKGPFSCAHMRRFFSNPQIAPCVVKAGGNFLLNALGNYYGDGVHAQIIGNKTVNAKNIISRNLKAEQKDEISSDNT